MLRLKTAATLEPVSLIEAKAHLNVDLPDNDTLIGAMVSAAREIVEQQTGRSLAAADYLWEPVGDCTSPLPLQPATITSEEGVRPIAFTTAPDIVPAALKAAILLLVGDMYVNRSASKEDRLQRNEVLAKLVFPYKRVLP